MALNNAQNIFNLIRIKASKEYQDVVPALTEKSPIGDVGTPILTNPMIFKEFSILLGAFIQYRVFKDAWSNPLAELVMEGGSPLGEYSGDIANNPVLPRDYDPTHPERLLDYAMTEDKVVFYARNIKEVFKLSIAIQDMQGAFASYEKFDEYVQMKKASLESGYQLSMYNHILEAIVTNYNAGVFVESPVKIGPNETNYSEWTREILSLRKKFKYPSTNYNRYGQLAGANGDFKAYSKPEDIVIMGTIDWLTADNVDFLAGAYNLSKAEIDQRIIEVPDFGYTYTTTTTDEVTGETKVIEHKVTTDIQAMVFDKRMLSCKNDLEINADFFNPETLVTNYYRHWWASYNCSPLANCVVFTSGSAVGLKSATVVDYGNPDGESLIEIKDADSEQNIKLDFVPDLYDTTIPIRDQDIEITAVHKISGADITLDIVNESIVFVAPLTVLDKTNHIVVGAAAEEYTDTVSTVILDVKITKQNTGSVTIPMLAEIYHAVVSA